MSFLHSGFLAASAVTATLPILIHLLLRRRRAPIDWAAMELLKEAIQRTSRRRRIEQLLLLTLRVLAIILVGVALAVPILGTKSANSSQRRTIVFVLDDSVASSMRVGAETELARLAQEAVSTIQSLRAGDRVALLHASKPPRVELLPTLDHTSVITALERAVPSESVVDFQGAFALVGQLVEQIGTPIEVEVLSPFRRGSIPEWGALAAVAQRDQSPISIRLTTSAVTTAANVNVVSVEPRMDVDGETLIVLVRLTRSGENLGVESSRVWLTGEAVNTTPARLVRWELGQTEAVMELLAPINHTTEASNFVAIEAHVSSDLLSADDSRVTLYESRRTTRVGVAGHRGAFVGTGVDSIPSSVWAARALAPSDLSRTTQVVELDAATLNARALLGCDAVVVTRPSLLTEIGWTALQEFVEAGGVLLFFPDGALEAQSWTTHFASEFGVPWVFASETQTAATPLRVAAQQPSQQQSKAAFRAIESELPALLSPLEMSRFLNTTSAPDEDVSLRLENGAPLFLATRPDGSARGWIALLTVSPELLWTNLPVKPAIVPLLQEAVRFGLHAASGARAGIVGEEGFFAGEVQGSLESATGKRLAIGADGKTDGLFSSRGVWRGSEKRDIAVAVNIDPAATRLDAVPRSEILKYFSPTGVASTSFSVEGTERVTRFLSQSDTSALVCLIALAIVLLSESILSRAFSHTSARRTTGLGSHTHTPLRTLGARASSWKHSGELNTSPRVSSLTKRVSQ